MTPDEQLEKLDGDLQREQKCLRKYDAYLRGEQPLKFLALEIKEEFGDRLAEVVINWPELVNDAYNRRLNILGFRMPESKTNGVEVDEGDAELWKIWQDNDMERQIKRAFYEAIGLGRCYAIVGARDQVEEGGLANPFDTATNSPLITIEHPTQVITEDDPRTGWPIAGLKRWKDAQKIHRATLYLPGETRFLHQARGGWVVDDVDEHKLGVVPVVPIVNRARVLGRLGRSQFASIIPIADAANKMATDMMVSGEFHAMPRRWALGMSRGDFKDEDGNDISPFEQIAGRIWAHPKKPGEVEVGQFPEADLAVFHNTLKLLAQLVAQLASLPPHYMAFVGENPASADAIRSSEAQLVKGAEDMQVDFGASVRRIKALSLLVRDGAAFDRRVLRAKVAWRDASTPTVAQAADAAVKKRQSGIITLRQARIDLGYSPEEIKRMEEEDAAEREQDPLRQIARNLPAGDPPNPEPPADPPAGE
jgi:hypothetical protein